MLFFKFRRTENGCSASEKDERWERIERKFFVRPEKALYAQNLMTRVCLPDGKYPKGKINSLYFDTQDLQEYQKSDDGDYKREKIRIRWYDNPGIEGNVPVYLELKSKKGFASKKKRRQFIIPAKQIHTYKTGGTILNRNLILQTLAEFNYFPERNLVPVIMISYQRLRFLDFLSGTRMSLDWQISSVPTYSPIGHFRPSVTLQGSVIEIKGTIIDIPLSLQPLHDACIDWSRFSKYAGCIESHMETNGSVGHTWPSGRAE